MQEKIDAATDNIETTTSYMEAEMICTRAATDHIDDAIVHAEAAEAATSHIEDVKAHTALVTAHIAPAKHV